MNGDRVPASYDGDWEIEYSEPVLTWVERITGSNRKATIKDGLDAIVRTGAFIGVLMYWPLTGLPILLLSDPDNSSDDGSDEDNDVDTLSSDIAIYLVILFVWVVLYAAFNFVVHAIGIQFPVEVSVTVRSDARS